MCSSACRDEERNNRNGISDVMSSLYSCMQEMFTNKKVLFPYMLVSVSVTFKKLGTK